MVRQIIIMIMLSVILSVGFVAANVSAYTITAQSYTAFLNASYVKDRPVNNREEGLEIKGTLPKLEGYTDASLQSVVNTIIDNVYFSKVAAAKDIKAKSVSFRYSLKLDGTVCSILIYSSVTSALSKEDVTSVNLDFSKNRLVGLNDFFTPVALKAANLVVTELIRKNPECYNQAFQGMNDDIAFYSENGKIVLNFSEGQVAPTTYGIARFYIDLSSFQNFTLPRDYYYTNNQAYSIKMIPLRTVCEALGFQLIYFQDSSKVEVRKNSYSTTVYFNSTSQKRFVEAEPENLNGVIYVPVSFFDDIPLVSYLVDPTGDISFAAYNQ